MNQTVLKKQLVNECIALLDDLIRLEQLQKINSNGKDYPWCKASLKKR